MCPLDEVRLNKIILDNGVFRKLVKKTTSRSESAPVLRQINSLIPAKNVSMFGLWGEYVGFTRPEFQNIGGWARIEKLTSINEFGDVVAATLNDLTQGYESLDNLAPGNLKRKADEFMQQRVSTHIPDARGLAEDIVNFKGQEISWDDLSRELSLFYAVDELFYLVRFLPVSMYECLNLMARDLKQVLQEYHHLPIYRFADSMIELLIRVHTEDPDPKLPRAIHTIKTATKGLDQLERRETADCMFVWSAVQRIFSSDGLEPVTGLTFDTQSLKRVRILIDTLAAKFMERSILGELQEMGLLRPGRVVLMCPETGAVKEDILIANQLTETLSNAANW